MAGDFGSVIDPYLEPKISLGRVNVSGDSGAQVRLTQTAEAAIYRKYRWVFEAGNYPRRPADADRS